jgi:hypothetical protein
MIEKNGKLYAGYPMEDLIKSSLDTISKGRERIIPKGELDNGFFIYDPYVKSAIINMNLQFQEQNQNHKNITSILTNTDNLSDIYNISDTRQSQKQDSVSLLASITDMGTLQDTRQDQKQDTRQDSYSALRFINGTIPSQKQRIPMLSGYNNTISNNKKRKKSGITINVWKNPSMFSGMGVKSHTVGSLNISLNKNNGKKKAKNR